MFGVGDLLLILLGGGTLATKSFKESEAKIDQRVKEELEQRFIERYTDPELEKKIEQDILNPDKYEEIWDRIERYKKEGGEVCEWDMQKNPAYSYWNVLVGKSRRPFRDINGNLVAKTKADTARLEGNRSVACGLLMHTYGKMTMHNAKWVAMRATSDELSAWLKGGWPGRVDMYTATLVDLNNDAACGQPNLIKPWRVLAMILICVLYLWLISMAKEISSPIARLALGIGGLIIIAFMICSWIKRP